MLLDKKIIFLTGGSSGIGYKCAVAYAAEGAHIALVSNDRMQIESALRVIGNERHIGIYCNVSKEEDVRQSLEKTIEHFGGLDVIHNNAGIVTPSKKLHDTSIEEWHLLMDTNLKSIYLTTKYGFNALCQTKGTILNTSSLVGQIGQHDHAAYSATKGGINALTKSMALDYAPYGIRVNCVCPAWVRTPAVQQWVDDQHNSIAVEEYINNVHPLGYCPEGDVIADACVFLLSERSRFITGCTLPVSGGAELGYRRLS